MAGKTVRLNISGMTCDGCADTASRYLKKEKGVLEVAIQWQSGTGEVTFDPEATSEEKILASRTFQGHYSAEVDKVRT